MKKILMALVLLPFMALAGSDLYMVVDLSGGATAENYPISFLSDVPEGGWTDEYKTTKLVMRRIEPGTFIMGSPESELSHESDETLHSVTLTKRYYIGVFEVTQRQWELVMSSLPSAFSLESCYATRPVERVSYEMIRGSSTGAQWPNSNVVDPDSFLGRVRQRTQLGTIDIPTEAQWEYACRAGSTTAYNYGEDDASNLSEYSRYVGNSGDVSYSKLDTYGTDKGTAPVGSYLPNAWGLYDMHGNVWEWCLDWYGTYAENMNPVGSKSGKYRIQRSGCWNDCKRWAGDSNGAVACRSANRFYNSPSYIEGNGDGLRLAMTVDEPLQVGLVAHYEFNGNAKDSSGYGNDGVVHGATLTTDRFGNENGAYKFDGNDWINATASASFNSASNANTVCFWMNARSWSDNLIPVLAQQFGCYFERRSSKGSQKYADYYIGPGYIEDDFELGFDVPFDTWHLWTITSTSGKIVIYIDGQFAVSKEDCGYAFAKNAGLTIGRIGSYDNRYLIGSLDDVRIYNRALSADEVKALYDSEKPPVKVWTVAFDACGGVASQDAKVVTNNTAIGELPTAERDGHKFLGWFSEIEGGTQVTPETIITNDVTFYAHWFDTSIGNVTGATNVLWRTGGDVPWATEETAQGWDVRSGAIGKSSETWVECVVTNGCRVAFEWKVSCEPEDEGEMYDFLSFSIDGEQKAAICGETGWTNDVYAVSGNGEHVLRWTYQKDNRTSEGEDCGWIRRVKVDPEVPVTFKDNGATSGEVPTIPTAYLGDEITVPGKGTLAKSCHAFGGWEYEGTTYSEGAAFTLGTSAVEFVAVWNAKVLGVPVLASPATPHVTTEKIAVSLQTPANAQGIRYTLDGSEPTFQSAVYAGPFEVADRGVTVKAVAFAYDWFDGACATWELTRAPWSAAECLNAETREFSFGGNADWVRDLGVTHDGEAAMRSGAIGNKQTSSIQMPVTGAGTVSFWCKVSSEWDPETREAYDGLAIAIDGKDVYSDLIGGEVGWTNITVSVSGAGEHVISWRYQKDKVESMGSDCAWLDEILWQADATVVPAEITGGKELPISRSWIERDLVDRYGPGKTEAFRTMYGNDYDLAVLMPNGKTTNGSTGYVWHDYIAGTDPTDTNSVFTAIFKMVDGVPVVTWEPDLGAAREYKIWGRETLDNSSAWQCPTDALHRFFKVTVEMGE